MFLAVVGVGAALAGCGGDDQCRTDDYPAISGGFSSVVHVSAGCPAAGADGSADRPYPTIAAGVAHASSGGAVLIAKGAYPENVKIKSSIALIGSSDAAHASAAQAEILATTSQDYAVEVTGTGEVLLRGLRIVKPVIGGIKVSGTTVTIEGTQIQGARPDPMGEYGYGLVAADNGSIILQHSAITGSASLGVFVSGAKATIEQDEIDDNAGGGVRVQDAADQVKIDGSTLQHNRSFGIGVFNSRAIILQNQILSTEAVSDEDEIGDGIVVSGAADKMAATGITAQNNVISKSSRTGILCSQTGAIILQNNTIDSSAFGAGSGAGIWIQKGLSPSDQNKIEGNHITGSRYAGISMTGETHGIILQNNVITKTALGTKFVDAMMFEIGDGISLALESSARILQNELGENGRFGAILDSAPASGTQLLMNHVYDNLDSGIILQRSPGIDATNNTYSGNRNQASATIDTARYQVLDQELHTN